MAKHMTKIFTFFLLLINFAHAAEEGESVLRRRGLGDVAASPTNLPPVREAWPENDTRPNSVGRDDPIFVDGHTTPTSLMAHSGGSVLARRESSSSSEETFTLDDARIMTVDELIVRLEKSPGEPSLESKTFKRVWAPMGCALAGGVATVWMIYGYFNPEEMFQKCPESWEAPANLSLEDLVNRGNESLTFIGSRCANIVINETAGLFQRICRPAQLCAVKTGSTANFVVGLTGLVLTTVGAVNYSFQKTFQRGSFKDIVIKTYGERLDSNNGLKEDDAEAFCKYAKERYSFYYKVEGPFDINAFEVDLKEWRPS